MLSNLQKEREREGGEKECCNTYSLQYSIMCRCGLQYNVIVFGVDSVKCGTMQLY